MRSNWTKALAATLFVGMGLALLIVAKSPSAAYAFEQTVEASKGIRSVRTTSVSPPAPESQDIWLEVDDNGRVSRLRCEEGAGETYRVLVCENGVIRWYSPPKKKLAIVFADVNSEFMGRREAWDPKFAVEEIYRRQNAGELDVQTQPPTSPGQPITLTATETRAKLPKGAHRVRYVLQIDSDTKLVTQRDTLWLKDGKYELTERRRYSDYNKPIDPDKFVLETPSDVQIEDETAGVEGMPQATMTDAEAAAAVVRRFIEALIAEDYEAAAKLTSSSSAKEVRRRWRKIRPLRVVAIGKAEPAPVAGPRAYRVPFAYETETKGKKVVVGPPVKTKNGPKTHRKAAVRPIPGKPDRWMIDGGI